MSIDNLLIKRLSYLEKIDIETEKFRKMTRLSIPNVSGWEISREYKNIILESFDYPQYADYNPIDYVYSYSMEPEQRRALIYSFGGNEKNALLLTPNNTISLTNVVNFISQFCNRNIGLLLPCYFTLPNLLNVWKLPYINLTMLRTETGYYLPKEEINCNKCQVLILTNPIFSTGKYLEQNDIDFLDGFLREGNYIISDESLAAPNKELIRSLGKHPNFIGIYSPHKFIHFNSFKFSCIIYNERFEDFFDQWNDVYSGSLNITNLQAIKHYLSANYQETLKKFYTYTNSKRLDLLDMIGFFPQFETDENSLGDFQCIFNKRLPYELGNDLSFIKNIIKDTKSVFYPGSLHGFQEKHGFAFRVNLCSYTTEVSNSLLKIFDYLSRYSI